jgi:molybdate transport system ATP-binding protein
MEQKDNQERLLIKLEDIAIRVREKLILQGTHWEIKNNQHWAILGPNGAGKTSLAGAIVGNVPVVKGKITRNYPRTAKEPIGYVSLELHQRLIAQEEDRDEARFFSGSINSFTKVGQTILSANHETGIEDHNFDRIVKLLEINYLLDRGIRFLSDGEMRKVLIARALMKSPRLLILDEPFEGLDVHSRERLKETTTGLIAQGVQVILVTHRFEEIIPGITHVLCLKDGSVFLQGERDSVLTPEHMDRLYDKKAPAILSLPGNRDEREALQKGRREKLVDLRNTSVKYGDVLVLDRVNWAMREGQNWAIVGPNGSGKTTLLSLITGDNVQAYANEIYLFGKRRGSGESVWDIKKKIGIVSPELQVHYRKRMRVYDVVLSGFFDSIGLYRKCTPEQQATAQKWIDLLGLAHMSEQWYVHLSFGEKRMVLLARSMVKSPTLLILDEPCQGLDRSNRGVILDLIDYIGRETTSHVIYVTHHRDEMPPCITHVLHLEKPQRDSSAARSTCRKGDGNHA